MAWKLRCFKHLLRRMADITEKDKRDRERGRYWVVAKLRQEMRERTRALATELGEEETRVVTDLLGGREAKVGRPEQATRKNKKRQWQREKGKERRK